MSLSIVMPCYNEAKIVEYVIRAYYSEIISRINDSELIIINDCSTDGTGVILKKLSREFPKLRVLMTDINSGHGKALRIGYEAAQKKWVFQVDSDNQFKAGEFWKLYELRSNYDFLLGYRKKRQDSPGRLILTTLIRFINFLLFGVWIKDANCAFRLIRRDFLIDALRYVETRTFAPNIIISILAKKMKKTITEIPVTYYNKKEKVDLIQHWNIIKLSFLGFTQLLKLRRTLNDYELG